MTFVVGGGGGGGGESWIQDQLDTLDIRFPKKSETFEQVVTQRSVADRRWQWRTSAASLQRV